MSGRPSNHLNLLQIKIPLAMAESHLQQAHMVDTRNDPFERDIARFKVSGFSPPIQ